MKSKSFVWVVTGALTAVLTIPEINFAQIVCKRNRITGEMECERVQTRPAPDITTQNLETAKRLLVGQWYLNGDRNKPCQISFSGSRFTAKNEHGQSTGLVYDVYDPHGSISITAINWEGGLTGEVRHQSIQWVNGTTWRR
jgi:hypothetical protein